MASGGRPRFTYDVGPGCRIVTGCFAPIAQSFKVSVLFLHGHVRDCVPRHRVRSYRPILVVEEARRRPNTTVVERVSLLGKEGKKN